MQQCSMRRPNQAPRSSFPIFHIYLSKLEHKAKYYLQYISKYFIFISTPPPFCTSAVSAPPPGCPMIVAWRRTQAGNYRRYKYKYTIRSIVCETSSHPVNQSFDHLVIGHSVSHLVTWSLGHSVIQTLGQSVTPAVILSS